jgi:glutamyl-tRNA synthetase
MVKVRFAPSPTGKLHLGSARTAVFNWLYARHSGGRMVLRIEDTDAGRSDEAYTESIIHDMKWMGLDYDEFYKQSERFGIYTKFIDKLLKSGKAYYCSCTREDLLARNKEKGIPEEGVKYDGHCRKLKLKPEGNCVVRLNTGAEREISFKDLVKKKITVSTKELDDFVIWKSDGSPTYNFAVVVDDAKMKVSHIIRGEDHITNTAKQIILYSYLKFALPQFAHLPLVLGKDKSPLSKRKGSTNIEYYRSIGILPEALLNAIARLGWSHGDDEVFNIDELIRFFDINKLNKSNAVYDEEKMVWVNSKHMKTIPLETMAVHFDEFLAEAGLQKTGRMNDPAWLLKAFELLRHRSETLKGLYEEIVYYAIPDYEKNEIALARLAELLKNVNVEKAFFHAKNLILSIRDFNKISELENELRDIAGENFIKFGELMQVLRVKLTGKLESPDIISVIRLLEKDIQKRL